MARLTQLRLVSVGHVRARFEDVLLDLRDSNGRALESVLWLRNGGGKSSLLSLFFAGVYPDQRHFLGKRSGGERRHLSNYILPTDHGVVACQWVLDSERTLFDSEPTQYLTGVFYERESAAEEANDGETGTLRRLFFAAIVSDGEPQLTIEGLPLFVEAAGTPKRRRTMKGFKRAWQSLRQQYPSHDVFVTDRQRDWAEQLKSRGIDPQLFFYQVCMNEREGGASELFSFDDEEDFADFLLEMTLDEQFAQQVRDQMSTFRQELIIRNEQFKPERELCAGLMDRMTRLAGVSDERARVNGEVATAQQELHSLGRWVQNRIESLRKACAEAESQAEEARRSAEEAHGQAEIHRQEAAALRRHACRLYLQDAVSQFEASQRGMNEAARREEIWQAAIPLKRAIDAERQAQRHRDELARKQRDHAPLIERLRQAATDLANALEYEAGRLRGQQAERRQAAQAEREKARHHRNSAAEAGESAVAAESEARRFQAALDEAATERDALVHTGAMLPEETAVTADRRLASCIGEFEQQLRDTGDNIKARRDDQQSCQTRREEAKTRLAEVQQEQKHLEADFRKAQQQRQLLERNAALLRLLETTEVNLDAALLPSIKKAEQEKRKVLEAILALRIEAAEDERAIVHLEEAGILPPSRDVEQLLKHLSSQHIRCWSGWSYIEKNVPREDRREVVRERPYLAEGVMVASVDYDRAVGVLQEGTPQLQSPVVVARADAIDVDAPITWSVVGPSSDAHFDQAAGAHELNTTHDRKTRRCDEIAVQDEWRRSLETLSHQLQSFREQYPSGWFGQNATARNRCEIEIERQSRLIQEAEERDKQLRSEITSLTDREEEVAGLRQTALRHLDRVQAFIRQHASKESPRVQGRDKARELAERSRSLQRSHLDKADACEQRAGLLESEATHAAERAKSIEDELTRVSHADPTSRRSQAGDLDFLRHEYTMLEQQYQEKVGSETLKHLAEQKDEDARRERAEFARILAKTPHIQEPDVAAELRTMPRNQSPEEVYESAKDAHWAAKQENGNDARRKQRCEENLAKAEDACRGIGISEDLPELVYPKCPGEADQRAESAAREAKEDDELAAMYERDAATHEEALRESRQRTGMLGKDLVSLQGIQQDHEYLFGRLGETPARPESAPVTESIEDLEVELHTTAIRERLHACANEHEELDERRDEAAKDVHRWVREERFRSLTNSVAARFAEFGAPALESKARYHIEKLDLRLFHIDEKLREADKQRDIVVRVILSAVDEALRLLTQVSRQSRLPQSLPGAGRHFLQITPSPPENPLDRRARINEFVDELLDKGENLDPVKLIQQAVRRVGSPIRVRLLHPDLEDAAHRVSITEMQRFSDGERLTCAILLYCTLARLRAKQEGYAGDRSSVLLLDNPIGTASRVRFLDLQREVARAMNIQLIYATGVNDLDAVATLPNVIRLRNSRIDRRTGKRLVELDELPENDSFGQVEAVRVAFTRDDFGAGWQDGSSDGDGDEPE